MGQNQRNFVDFDDFVQRNFVDFPFVERIFVDFVPFGTVTKFR